MKKKLSILMVILAMISACTRGGNGPSDGNKVVSDDLLRVTPDPKEDYENPVILPAAHGSTEAPDPFVYRFNGKYYLYMTTGGGFVRCYVSTDLLHWEAATNGPAVGVCYQGSGIGNTPYAPEVIYYNGHFYMVTSPSGNGHFILISESPEGPFTKLTDNVYVYINPKLLILHF